MIRTQKHERTPKSVCLGCLYRDKCTWHANEPEKHPITSCNYLRPYDWKDAEREAAYKRSQAELVKILNGSN